MWSNGRLRFVFIALVTLIAFYIAAPVQSQGRTLGLLQNDPGSFVGYTLYSPLFLGETYLLDHNGDLVHSWDTGPGPSPYLMEDGSVIHTAEIVDNLTFIHGGRTGGVQRYDWDGNLTWEFTYSGPDYHLHHDLEVLPNGNVLLIAWERRSRTEAIAAGRDPDFLISDLHPLRLIEVEPVGPTGGNIVWQWDVWDHLIQDFDATKDNFGVVAEHPEFININFSDANLLGEGEADWQHTNSVEYNPDLDQILVSVRHFSEVWVIDHSTTTAEAASHNGGNSGKGGDLLYRWGNPEAYGAGDAGDQQLFVQHDARWIEPGLPGAGNILIFNNGEGRPGGNASSVDEIVPPVDGFGSYALTPGQAYGPSAPTWTYSDPATFYSRNISGAQRLPNGNTFINEGSTGEFFEVDPSGAIVWRYANPVGTFGPLTQGDARPAIGLGVFRAIRYAPDYPGLAGRDLTPGGPLEFVLDSDDDGLFDHDETKIYGTEPLVADTDLDGLSDGDEVLVFGSDPLRVDTDGDGLSDGDEVLVNGTDPTLVDTDGDGFSDGDEIFIRGTDPLRAELLGDVNCDYEVSSIDAALVLQLTAGVVPFLFCQDSGDVNGDGDTTSVDATIILQFTAGLIPSLPP